MLAACNARANSTDATVAQLLAHESASDVARMQDCEGWTALMFAAGHASNCSTDTAVSLLLAHESATDVAHIQNNLSQTALMITASHAGGTSSHATLAQLLAHESAADVIHLRQFSNGWTALKWAASKGHSTVVDILCSHSYTQSDDIEHVLRDHPAAFYPYIRRLRESARERAVLSRALCQGFSLVEATTLLYL
jgi:ankyrin repeat protein